MKMTLKFFTLLAMYWACGVIFFCVIPPLVIPVCAFFWPIYVLPIWAGAALIFAFCGLLWQSLNYSDEVAVDCEQYKLNTTLPMGLIRIRNLAVLPLDEIKKKMRAQSVTEHMHVEGDWLDGYNLSVYYDDLEEWKKGEKVASKFKDKMMAKKR